MADTASRPLRVFLCHSSSDKPTVREIYQKLSIEKWIDVWLDEEKLLPGQDWAFEIEKALDDSDAIIVMLSTGSVSKDGYVQREMRAVLEIALEKPEGTIFIVPVRLDDCERPRRLRPIQGVDYFPPERREAAYTKLLRSLELRHRQRSTTSLTPAQEQPLNTNSEAEKLLIKAIEEYRDHQENVCFFYVKLAEIDDPNAQPAWKRIAPNTFQRVLPLAADPKFELTVTNNGKADVTLFEVGVAILERLPRDGGETMGEPEWTFPQADLSVDCPKEWKSGDISKNEVSTPLPHGVILQRDVSFVLSLVLKNFCDDQSASSSKVRFWFKTNKESIRSDSILLEQ
jgi:hypothetical protein